MWSFQKKPACLYEYLHETEDYDNYSKEIKRDRYSSLFGKTADDEETEFFSFSDHTLVVSLSVQIFWITKIWL